MFSSASLRVPTLPTVTPLTFLRTGRVRAQRIAFSACAYGEERLTCEGLCAGVDTCQALGRPKIGDLQDAAVGVDQHVVPLVDRDDKGKWLFGMLSGAFPMVEAKQIK